MTDARFCSHTARAGERLSSAGCFSLVLTASSLPDSGSQATVAAPPYCEGPETDGFRAEVEENGILGFEDIEGAKGEEGAWEGWVGKEVGPRGLAAKGVGVKEGERDRRADGLAPPMVVSRGGEEVEAEDLGWVWDTELVWGNRRGEEAVREGRRRDGGSVLPSGNAAPHQFSARAGERLRSADVRCPHEGVLSDGRRRVQFKVAIALVHLHQGLQQISGRAGRRRYAAAGIAKAHGAEPKMPPVMADGIDD